jgi:hypothetical protein
MDVVDKVLVPPEAVFSTTDRASIKADVEKAIAPAEAPAVKANNAGCAGASTLLVMFWVALALLLA